MNIYSEQSPFAVFSAYQSVNVISLMEGDKLLGLHAYCRRRGLRLAV